MSGERTIGDALAGARVSDAVAYGAAVLVIVGSIAPWVSAGIASASGFDGDGKIAALLAVLAMLALWRRRTRWAALLFGLTFVLGIYELIHINHEAAHDTLFGQHFISVGWGVYLVIAAALVGLAPLLRSLLKRGDGSRRYGG